MADADVIRRLGDSELFAELDGRTLEALAEHVKLLRLHAGDVLLEEGDPGESVFIVGTGRLRAFVTEPSGTEIVVGEIGTGEVVGEMALLSAAPRSATIRAIRDSTLLELPNDRFMGLVVDRPAILISVTRLIVERLQRSIHRTELGRRIRMIAVLPVAADGTHGVVADKLGSALGTSRKVEIVDRSRLDSTLGSDRSEEDVIRFLHRLESDHDAVLLVGDAPGSAWTERCARQADMVLFVADARRAAPVDRVELPGERSGTTRPGVRLILAHTGPERPRNTAAWLAAVGPDRHHHVRTDDAATVARLARILDGESIGLVLGGGGARGYAHLGVVKALMDAGVPIDHVGGASSGATIAAALSLDMSWDDAYAASRNATVDHGSLVDFTFPAVALARGRKVMTGIREAYGDMLIEDAWLDFFCVSSDLSAGRLRVHSTGPMALAVRASVSIPGTFPPVLGEGNSVLVDGGIMNNLPVDVMRSVYDPGRVIAVDLRAGTHIPSADLDTSGTV